MEQREHPFEPNIDTLKDRREKLKSGINSRTKTMDGFNKETAAQLYHKKERINEMFIDEQNPDSLKSLIALATALEDDATLYAGKDFWLTPETIAPLMQQIDLLKQQQSAINYKITSASDTIKHADMLMQATHGKLGGGLITYSSQDIQKLVPSSTSPITNLPNGENIASISILTKKSIQDNKPGLYILIEKKLKNSHKSQVSYEYDSTTGELLINGSLAQRDKQTVNMLADRIHQAASIRQSQVILDKNNKTEQRLDQQMQRFG